MAKMKHTAGKASAVRKHEWMPCVLVADREKYSGEEWVKLMKRCYFTDFFTDAEWRAIVSDDAKSLSVNRSRIKKKVAGWLMVSNRLAAIRPDWYLDAVHKAESEYEELIGKPLEWGIVPSYRPSETDEE